MKCALGIPLGNKLNSPGDHRGWRTKFLDSVLSHELRTPLNAILGWAKILRSSKADAEDLGEGLSAIERNAQAQAQLIEDLLDISRITSGNFLALASWCATRGRLHKIEKRFSGEISLQGSDFRCSIGKNTHDGPP